MPYHMFTPPFVADGLVATFFVTEALRRRRRWPSRIRTGRGTTLVFWGCYVIALLALNATASWPPRAVSAHEWQ